MPPAAEKTLALRLRSLHGWGAVVAAVGLSVLFWAPLWQQGGLIGGDIYPYYLPQKAFYADQLQQGRLPLWNPLVSFGYPQHAESQTGALYPLNLVLYRVLDVNAAYSASHLLHYIVAYLGAWLLGRRLGLQPTGALLAAIVFIYGWFPPRSCLEWAILGGAHFPWLLWCVESWLQDGRRGWLLGAAALLGHWLLAGHFHLAFIALVVIGVYAPLRLWWAVQPTIRSPGGRARALQELVAALALGFALAGPQLVPSLELKQRSQRADPDSLHQLYGHLPPWYFSQALWPLLWYGPEQNPDVALGEIFWGAVPNATNKIEAHLYFGAAPFWMVCGAGVAFARLGRRPTRRGLLWGALGLMGAALATGWPLMWLRTLPGFGYFSGPGRYGLITAWAMALAAGHVLDRWTHGRGAALARSALAVLVLAVTVGDLFFVSRWVTNTAMVARPAADIRRESPVAAALQQAAAGGRPVRLWAPGPNLPTLLDVNCVPQYLGIGPAAYFTPELRFPERRADDASAASRRQVIDWLQRYGTTHILSFEPLVPGEWPVSPPRELFDSFLNAAWGRGGQPVYLHELHGSRPFCFFHEELAEVSIVPAENFAHTVAADVESPRGGRLVLLCLDDPGWSVAVDGVRASPQLFEGAFRAVEVPAGRHRVRWSYEPASLRWGALLGAAAVGVWILVLVAETIGRVRAPVLPTPP